MTDSGLRRGFWVVVTIVVVAAIGIALLIHAVNAGNHRPEGIAERWLQAVGDTGRKGVRSDARHRAEDHGPLALAAPLVRPKHDTRHSYFVDLEVGEAHHAADVARVPFRLHQYVDSGSPPLQQGTVVMARAGDSWRVTAIDARQAGEKVPSEGGAPPSRAPLGAWVGALGIGVVLAAGCSALVAYADRTARRALAATAS